MRVITPNTITENPAMRGNHAILFSRTYETRSARAVAIVNNPVDIRKAVSSLPRNDSAIKKRMMGPNSIDHAIATALYCLSILGIIPWNIFGLHCVQVAALLISALFTVSF